MIKKAAALIWMGAFVAMPAFAVEEGDVAPSWAGVELKDDQQVQFPQVTAGKPAVLVFWATWCPYCKAFMPFAEGIEKDYGDRGVQIVTFNAKERDRGDPKAYIESLGFPMVAIAEADEIAEAYGIKFIPGLLVVGGDGLIAYRRGWTDLPAGKTVAAQWDEEVRAALDGLLN
jgi:cytochrome c biogenesis protein CcmG/thiol:disulfide interchange protein DsbE